MKLPRLQPAIAILVSFHFSVSAATRYVDMNSTNPVVPYETWATAATNIQDAASYAGAGDTVLVTNGIYQYGGASFNGSNRVHVAASVTVQSVNGPAVTTIVGYQVPGTTNGNSAVRCVYLSEFSTLSGFTLTNGATQTSGSGDIGGGVLTETSCSVSNCIIAGNACYFQGGGAYIGAGSVANNCIFSGNVVMNGTGGGAYGGGAGTLRGTLSGCIIISNIAGDGSGVGNCIVDNSLLTENGYATNSAQYGGSAAYLSTLDNCTIAGNFSGGLGAANGCTLNNSIIYYNVNGLYADCYQCRLTNSCTPLGNGNSSTPNGSISNTPGFVNPGGDYHLNAWSRCVDAGNSALVTGSTDLDGNPRIVGAAVDMGCYENQSPLQGVVHYVSLTSTNPVAPYTNWMTAATNIQDAVAAAQTGESVIADDGIYTNGGTVVYGAETNRVALTNAITLLSAGGAQVAVIYGGPQTRCVYVGTSAVLMGFTLTNGNGSGIISGDITNEESGGGAWCAAGGVISNCFIVGNNANTTAGLGGGVFGGTIYNSTITNNNYGYGAVALAALYNCTVASNGWSSGSELGGGLDYGTASNCVITGNRAYFGGAGVYRSVVYNSTILGNVSSGGPGGGAYQSEIFNCSVLNNMGGGAFQSILSNCIVNGNTWGSGGGTYQCTNYNCMLSGNVGSDGGGANAGILFNCILTGNTGTYGGGAYNAALYNCTVVSNTAVTGGGGVFGGPAYDSIVYYNSAPTGSNFYGAQFAYCCTIPDALAYDSDSITNPPVFVNIAAGDFHEQTNSPTINDGLNLYVGSANFPTNGTDYDGNPRIVGGTVDIGAFEYQGPNYGLPVPIQWLRQYGLPANGSADYVDSDGTGMNNWQKWIAGLNPTNPASVLVMSPPASTNNSPGISVTWQSVNNRNYNLQRATDLTMQPAFFSIQSNIVGQAGTTSYTDTTATNSGPYFYRVGIQ
jgi:hypothetical protein